MNARAEALLREQAERDLECALRAHESLVVALNRLTGARFGVILGAAYDISAGDPRLLVPLQIVF